MDCARFEEAITDYLDCGLPRAERRAFCEHLLSCRDCHSLFNDVRATIDACRSLKTDDVIAAGGVEQRIIGATTAGEMMSCRTLDALISDYFDGLIERDTEAIFDEHFAVCDRCRALVEGVRESIESPAVTLPLHLPERIFAATSRLLAKAS